MPADSKWEWFPGEDLAMNRQSGIFYAVKAFKGIPNLFKSTGQKDKRKAKKELPRLIKAHLEVNEDGKRAAGRCPTVADVIDEILQTEAGKLRIKTQNKRAFYFKRLRDEMGLGPLPMDQLSLKVWASRLALARKKRPHRRTFWDYSKHANILLRYAYRQQYVPFLVSLPNPDPKTDAGTVLTNDEIRLLFEVMGETMRDQLVLAYECCMRLREILHLSWDRVDLETGEITLRAQDVKTGSKTGRGRIFVMTPHALERLKKRRERLGSTERWVFPSPTHDGPVDDNKAAWQRAKTKALSRFPPFQHWVRFHDLRHSSLTHLLLDKKANPLLVSEYAGVSIDTIQRVYLHSSAEKTREVAGALSVWSEK